MTEIEAIVQEWLNNLLLDQHREIYQHMTKEQQTVVKLALRYPSERKEISS